MKKFLLFIIFWTWCLLQSFVGLCIYVFICIIDRKIFQLRLPNGSMLVRTNKLGGGISLGYFVFSLNLELYAKDHNVIITADKLLKEQDIMDRHEQGHTTQGFIFGLLYLIVIGLPSFVWAACFEGYRKKNKISYYWFYTERWADKIAGIDRSIV